MSSAQCRYSKNSRFLVYKQAFVEPFKDLSIGAKYFSKDEQHKNIDSVYINKAKQQFNINNLKLFLKSANYKAAGPGLRIPTRTHNTVVFLSFKFNCFFKFYFFILK